MARPRPHPFAAGLAVTLPRLTPLDNTFSDRAAAQKPVSERQQRFGHHRVRPFAGRATHVRQREACRACEVRPLWVSGTQRLPEPTRARRAFQRTDISAKLLSGIRPLAARRDRYLDGGAWVGGGERGHVKLAR